jgi:cytochrome c oxidase cbb3-type subunit 4
MKYDQIAHLIKMGGTVFFFLAFMLVLLYVFMPSNKKKFDQAAYLPLEDEDISQRN